MTISTLRNIAILGAAALGLGACTDGYGYGYSGVSLGYGPGYYGDYYGGYGGAYGSPYWGWWGDYYYPGTGYYVYDRWSRPYRWNDRQRDYWQGRRQGWRGDRGQFRDNWRDFRGDGPSGGDWRPNDGRGSWQGGGTGRGYQRDRRGDNRDWGGERRRDWGGDRRGEWREQRGSRPDAGQGANRADAGERGRGSGRGRPR